MRVHGRAHARASSPRCAGVSLTMSTRSSAKTSITSRPRPSAKRVDHDPAAGDQRHEQRRDRSDRTTATEYSGKSSGVASLIDAPRPTRDSSTRPAVGQNGALRLARWSPRCRSRRRHRRLGARGDGRASGRPNRVVAARSTTGRCRHRLGVDARSDHGPASLVDHRLSPGQRLVRVDRHVGGAGAQHTEDGDDRVRTSAAADGQRARRGRRPARAAAAASGRPRRRSSASADRAAPASSTATAPVSPLPALEQIDAPSTSRG